MSKLKSTRERKKLVKEVKINATTKLPTLTGCESPSEPTKKNSKYMPKSK